MYGLGRTGSAAAGDGGGVRAGVGIGCELSGLVLVCLQLWIPTRGLCCRAVMGEISAFGLLAFAARFG